MSTFSYAAKYIVRKWEQYWSDHPNDPGGLTIWGVAHASWPDEVNTMKNMLRDDAYEYALKHVYRKKWGDADCDKYPTAIAVIIFDMAIQHGVRSNVAHMSTGSLDIMKVNRGAIDMLQQAAGAVPDGRVGPNTMRRINSWHPLELLDEVVAVRNVYYAGLEPYWKDRIGLGWMRRSAELNRVCVQAHFAKELMQVL